MRTRYRRCCRVVIGGVLLLQACTEPEPATSPTAPQGMRALQQPQPPPRGIHATFYQIATQVPGFAGVVLDPENGGLTVLVSRADAAEGARPHVQAIIDRRLASDPEWFGGRVPVIRVRRVEYDFLQLYSFLEIVRGVVSDPDVTDWMVRESLNRVVVGVRNAGAIQRIRERIMTLGVPEGALIVEVGSGIVPTATLEDRFSEAFGGLRVTGADGCTLGVNALDSAVARRTFITASHCTTEKGPDPWPGAFFYQPNASSDTWLIGREYKDYAAPPCPPPYWPGWTCRYSDAALIAYEASAAWKFNHIAATSTGNTFSTHVPLSGVVWGVMENDIVTRVGATSGTAAGRVIASCRDAKSFTPGGQFRNEVIGCAVQVEAPVRGGDSGGPAYLDRTTPRRHAVFLGIVFGADTSFTTFYYSSLGSIQIELDATLIVYGVTTEITGPSRIRAPGTYTWRSNPLGSSTGAYSFRWEKRWEGSTNWGVVSRSETYSEYWEKVNDLNLRFFLRVTVTGGTRFGQVATSAEFPVLIRGGLF